MCRFAQAWWIPAAAIVLGLAVLLQLLIPYAQRLGTHHVRSRAFATQIRQLENHEHVGHPSVRIVPMRDQTTAANAFAIGIGPSRGVFIWDTMLDGRFTPREVRFVVAHELGHLARRHIWKGIAWGGLIGMPILALVAFVTGRRSGLRNPAAIPLAFLTIATAGMATAPFANAISRRYEAEADWRALVATHDAAAARGLFVQFVPTTLEEPNPPSWDYAFLENHPTIAQRLAMVRAFSSAQASRGGP